jgi:hypothetical protein
MNSAIHSTISSNRLSITRRSRAYRNKMFRRLLYGLPVVATVGWEYRVWKRKLYFNRNRHHFPGSTPFYGKMWGYESDYMIETSLNDGDLVFWQTDPLSIHIHEAICRFAYRHLKGDYDAWDFCGVIKKINGKCHVFGPNSISVLYSDLVADHRTTSLAIRRLVDTSSNGESRHQFVSNLSTSEPHTSINIGARGFLEYSLKTLAGSVPKLSNCLVSFVRPESRIFPLNLLTQNPPAVTDISEVFMDPLVNKSLGTSYSPPFFVRRFDNEYYNHNRTKNIIVDWDLLTQRDLKNRLVSEHNRKDDSHS